MWDSACGGSAAQAGGVERHDPAPRAAVTRAVGAYGERMAVRHLQSRGLDVLATNWRCPAGEIDIVAVDGRCLVVVEVKTRRTADFGLPVEQVPWRKLARLRRLAAMWLAVNPGPYDDIRVDIVGVLRPRSGPGIVDHLVGVL